MGKFNISSLETDEKLELNGVWLTYDGDFEVKIARVGNPKYQSWLRKKSKPYQRKLSASSMSKETIDMANDWAKECAAKYILLDWKNLQENKKDPEGNNVLDSDGNPEVIDVPYSSEKALEYFMCLKDFWEEIHAMAKDSENFKREEQEKQQKN